ncbi:MAG: AAA family ATPase, partial [Bacteroidales bacterium]|nr:AAA family ATPase [Candidatus Cryptobacteroides caccocaballi]
NFSFSTKDSHSSLCDAVTIVRGAFREKDGFFLRAESAYNALSYIDSLAKYDKRIYNSYGGQSLHSRSHGEGFMDIVTNRFGGHGLYILDEPESALSVTRQFELMTKMKELVDKDSQFIVCTHSPILMAYPGASILELSSDGIRQVPYEQTTNYQITKYFLNNYRSMLREMGFDDIELFR